MLNTSSRVMGMKDAEIEEVVRSGVELLREIDESELGLPEVVDRIELVTRNPSMVRRVLEVAEQEGVIDRGSEGGRVELTADASMDVSEDSPAIIKRSGEYTCDRCGRSLSTGNFVNLESREMGPFCPDCVQKVLGRD